MWQYILVSLMCVGIYFKIGKEIAYFIFLAFIVYKMYESIKFLSKGKSEMSYDSEGNILKWNFEGTLFSFNADLETMTARFTCPVGETTIHNRYVELSKYITGSIDVEIPLKSLLIFSLEETKTKDISYSGIAWDYRTDGSFGQVYVPNVVSVTKNTGRLRINIMTFEGSPKGSFEEGKENLAWSRDSYEVDKSYHPASALSNRQATDFLEKWNMIEEAIKARDNVKQ